MRKAGKGVAVKDRLTNWEWSTLVASWRYYEYGHSIQSASFPGDILERFWGKNGQRTWSDRVRIQIARQFVEVDHGVRGIDDWELGSVMTFDSDAHIWRKFYTFLKNYLVGTFLLVTVSDGKRTEVVQSFRYGEDLFPVEQYISNPWVSCRVPKEFMVKIEGESPVVEPGAEVGKDGRGGME